MGGVVKADYPVATERLEALKLTLGSRDFQDAEGSRNQTLQRGQADMKAQVKELKEAHGIRESVEPPNKQGGCYLATATYGA